MMSMEEALQALQDAEHDAREWANVTYHALRDSGMAPGMAGAAVIEQMRGSLPKRADDLQSALIKATMLRVAVEEAEDLMRRDQETWIGS